MAKAVMEPRVLPLTKPVVLTFRGPSGDRQETIDVLKFRVPVGKDFRKMGVSDNKIDCAHAFGAAICDVDEKVIDSLCADDWAAFMEIAEGFLPESQKTGTSS